MQRRFTKKITGLSKFPYSVRLKKLNLETLESIRLKCDLVTLYKLIAGSFSSDCHDFEQFSLGVMTLKYKNNVLRLMHLSIIFQIELLVCGTNCRIVLLKLQHVLYVNG